MRSALVHRAQQKIPGRFQLIHLTAAITRKFHVPAKQTVSRSISESLERIAEQGEKTFILSAEKQTEQAVAGVGLVTQVLIAESREAAL